MIKRIIRKPEIWINGISMIIISIICLKDIKVLDYPVILNDEFGYWANAISLGNYDWKDLIAYTPYYSWGYSLFLIFIVFFVKSPFLAYKIAILLNVVFLIGSYFLCISICKILFANRNTYLVRICSLIAVIYPANIVYSQVTWTESLLVFLTCLVFFELVKLDHLYSTKRLISVIAIVTFMYAVHQRMIGVVLITLICETFILLKNKKNIFWILIPLGCVACGYYFHENIKDLQLTSLWENSQTSSINNVALTSDIVTNYINVFFEKFNDLIISLFAKMIYVIIGTSMMILPFIGYYLNELVHNFKNKNFYHDFFISKTWVLSCFIVMWFLCSLQMINWQDRQDILVYGRYMDTTITPLLLLALMNLSNILLRKSSYLLFITEWIMVVIGLKWILPRLTTVNSVFNTVCSPIIGGFYEINRNWAESFWIIFIITSVFTFLMVSYFLIKKKKFIYFLYLLIAIFYGWLSYEGEQYVLKWRNSLERQSWPVADQIATEKDNKEILYVKDTLNDPYSVNPKYIQFRFWDRSIHVITEKDLDNLINSKEDFIFLINPKDKTVKERLEKKLYKNYAETEILSVMKKEE